MACPYSPKQPCEFLSAALIQPGLRSETCFLLPGDTGDPISSFAKYMLYATGFKSSSSRHRLPSRSLVYPESAIQPFVEDLITSPLVSGGKSSNRTWSFLGAHPKQEFARQFLFISLPVPVKERTQGLEVYISYLQAPDAEINQALDVKTVQARVMAYTCQKIRTTQPKYRLPWSASWSIEIQDQVADDISRLDLVMECPVSRYWRIFHATCWKFNKHPRVGGTLEACAGVDKSCIHHLCNKVKGNNMCPWCQRVGTTPWVLQSPCSPSDCNERWVGGLRRDIFRASQSSDEYSAFVQSGTTDQVKMGLGWKFSF
jgi:hypothetical protein